MRIHTSACINHFRAAARCAGVSFERLEHHGSRSDLQAFDVVLNGSGRNHPWGRDYQAATWDEWGMFLAEVFNYDPNAKAGNAYIGRSDFRDKTCNRFDTLTPRHQHRNHRWSHGTPRYQSCACGAERIW
jgi:hypothetical protein